ncbi:NUP84 [Sanghuangporus vaninii]
MSAMTFYAQAAEVLAGCLSNRDDLDAVLDRDKGFAPRLSKMCQKRLHELKEATEGQVVTQATKDEITMLKLESNTWDLVQLLMSVRKTEPAPFPSAKELLRKNPYLPTRTLAQSILRDSPLLNELVIVREWLHDSAPVPIPPENATGYWKFTRLRLQQAERTGDRRDVEKLVTELDPDALNRENNGKVLFADDATYEKALAQALYGYVRAGKIDEAVELCRRAKRPWRAGCIRGSLLFDWKALTVQTQTNENGDTEFAEGWSGNKRRKLWKQTCTRAALNPLLSEPDRALHAALAPSAATSVVLKSVCRSWHDHLWAQVSVVCEGRTSDALHRIGEGYWEGGIEAIERIAAEEASAATFTPAREQQEKRAEEREEREWEREAVAALESLTHVGVAEGPPSTDPFHVSQLHIILNRTDKLLDEFAVGLQSGEFNPTQPNFPSLTRFFAHLCLFLRLIDMPIPADATQIILEVYLQVLERAGQREHIALYASALGDNAVERYALFLTSLDLSVDIDERRQALLRAQRNTLDMIRVAQVTAEKTLEKAFEMLPRMKVTLPPVVTNDTLSDTEWFLIRSIEWTTFYEQTYPDALEQANAIIRYFLGCGRIHGARTLLRMLPSQLKLLPAEGARSRSQSTEYMHYLQFFGIWELFDSVAEAQTVERSLTTKGAKEKWLDAYSKLLDDIRERIIELLTTEWLVNEEEVARSQTRDQRKLVMVRIRRIYIPEFVVRLHDLLVGSGDRIPRNLKHAFSLANIVADSRYGLYEDFISDGLQRMEDYLRSIRQAILRGLENGGSDPLRPLRVIS